MPALESLVPGLVRLSARLSRRVFSSLTAPFLDSCPPAELEAEADSGGCGDVAALDVSIFKTGWGCLPFGWRSCSFQSAGVGGTGPSAVMPSGTGRLVGGDAIGSVVRFKL